MGTPDTSSLPPLRGTNRAESTSGGRPSSALRDESSPIPYRLASGSNGLALRRSVHSPHQNGVSSPIEVVEETYEDISSGVNVSPNDGYRRSPGSRPSSSGSNHHLPDLSGKRGHSAVSKSQLSASNSSGSKSSLSPSRGGPVKASPYAEKLKLNKGRHPRIAAGNSNSSLFTKFAEEQGSVQGHSSDSHGHVSRKSDTMQRDSDMKQTYETEYAEEVQRKKVTMQRSVSAMGKHGDVSRSRIDERGRTTSQGFREGEDARGSSYSNLPGNLPVALRRRMAQRTRINSMKEEERELEHAIKSHEQKVAADDEAKDQWGKLRPAYPLKKQNSNELLTSIPLAPEDSGGKRKAFPSKSKGTAGKEQRVRKVSIDASAQDDVQNDDLSRSNSRGGGSRKSSSRKSSSRSASTKELGVLALDPDGPSVSPDAKLMGVNSNKAVAAMDAIQIDEFSPDVKGPTSRAAPQEEEVRLPGFHSAVPEPGNAAGSDVPSGSRSAFTPTSSLQKASGEKVARQPLPAPVRTSSGISKSSEHGSEGSSSSIPALHKPVARRQVTPVSDINSNSPQPRLSSDSMGRKSDTAKRLSVEDADGIAQSLPPPVKAESRTLSTGSIPSSPARSASGAAERQASGSGSSSSAYYRHIVDSEASESATSKLIIGGPGTRLSSTPGKSTAGPSPLSLRMSASKIQLSAPSTASGSEGGTPSTTETKRFGSNGSLVVRGHRNDSGDGNVGQGGGAGGTVGNDEQQLFEIIVRPAMNRDAGNAPVVSFYVNASRRTLTHCCGGWKDDLGRRRNISIVPDQEAEELIGAREAADDMSDGEFERYLEAERKKELERLDEMEQLLLKQLKEKEDMKKKQQHEYGGAYGGGNKPLQPIMSTLMWLDQAGRGSD